jgi:hypothetical protein
MHDWHAVMNEAKSRQEVVLQEADRARLVRALANGKLDHPQMYAAKRWQPNRSAALKAE